MKGVKKIWHPSEDRNWKLKQKIYIRFLFSHQNNRFARLFRKNSKKHFDYGGRGEPLPKTTAGDDGPEFISRDFDAWAYHRGIMLDHIHPGKPVENSFIESFNGKFREECLEENIFSGIEVTIYEGTIFMWCQLTI